jgi:trehalose 6-phosphate phosphatase
MNGARELEAVDRHVRAGRGLNLFLDYDGTLVPIGRGPRELVVEPELAALLAGLARYPGFSATVLSARPLSALVALFPIPELNLAGLYGLEIQLEGQRINRGEPPERVRPVLEQLKARWTRLIAGRSGFWIEDKGLGVALHASGAEPAEARDLVRTAREAAAGWLYLKNFLILGGDDYLEVVPGGANKGQAVTWLLAHNKQRPGRLPVYFGDDDNDDQAFAVIQRAGGVAVGVGARFPLPHATTHVESPVVVRQYLKGLLAEAQSLT